MSRFHRATRTSEPLVIPGRISRVYLSPDQLRRLHFKPTIGTIQLSEGHEAKFNCSIDIPDARLEPTIIWVKNGQELAANLQVVVNELQTITDGVTTLLSTVRCVPYGGETLCARLITQTDRMYCITALTRCSGWMPGSIAAD